MKRWYARWVNSPIANDIASSLRCNPDSWRPSIYEGHIYTLVHRSGVEVWVASGWWFCDIREPAQLKLGLIGRTRVWLAALRHIRAADAKRLEDVRSKIALSKEEQA